LSNPFNINLIGKKIIIKKEFMIEQGLSSEKRTFVCCRGRGCYPNKTGRDILGIDYDVYNTNKTPELILDGVFKKMFNFRFESHQIEKVLDANSMIFLKAKSYSKLDNILWCIFSILRNIFYYSITLSIFEESRKTIATIPRLIDKLSDKIKKTFKTIFM